MTSDRWELHKNEVYYRETVAIDIEELKELLNFYRSPIKPIYPKIIDKWLSKYKDLLDGRKD